jgi:hypothetical protein
MKDNREDLVSYGAIHPAPAPRPSIDLSELTDARPVGALNGDGIFVIVIIDRL